MPEQMPDDNSLTQAILQMLQQQNQGGAGLGAGAPMTAEQYAGNANAMPGKPNADLDALIGAPPPYQGMDHGAPPPYQGMDQGTPPPYQGMPPMTQNMPYTPPQGGFLGEMQQNMPYTPPNPPPDPRKLQQNMGMQFGLGRMR